MLAFPLRGLELECSPCSFVTKLVGGWLALSSVPLVMGRMMTLKGCGCRDTVLADGVLVDNTAFCSYVTECCLCNLLDTDACTHMP